MIRLIIGYGIATLLMTVEYLLSAKLKNPLWGGIIPIAMLIGTVYTFASGLIQLNLHTFAPFLLITSFMFGDWVMGREKYKKNQQKELDKMKAKDIYN